MVKPADLPTSIVQERPDKVNILLVDDRRANLLALEALLTPLGERLVSASSGREALRHILQTEFAVILMDVQMPDLDGLETAALIRERETSRYIPIIFITAINTDDAYVYQGYSVGAVDYISKPFNPSMLAAKVSVFVDLFRKEKELKQQTKLLHEMELEALRLKQREQEQKFEQEMVLAMNRQLEQHVQERTAELEAFCYAVSHDLRTPLRSIHGYSSSLEQDHSHDLTTEAKDVLRKIAGTAKKMDQLILALLALSRITRAELKRTNVDLSELAKSIIDEFRSNEKGRAIDVEIQEHMVSNGDPALIRSLLFNLIGNAWKFTVEQEAPSIRIGSCVRQNGETAFFVKDNGVGFNPKYSHKLFQPFERLHSADTYPGSGIGLATVFRIVRKHGGIVWAQGEENSGAEFYFTL